MQVVIASTKERHMAPNRKTTPNMVPGGDTNPFDLHQEGLQA